ncbi:MAG: PHP-associated domain-containing protein [Myxococcota bacterium]|nr:PHP-associated domain-containing protein [Myxococcota bacterium]
MLVDLQVEIPSDVDNLIASTKAAGLDGIVLTSNETLFPVVSDLKDNEEGVHVFSGAKVATNNGLLLCLIPNPGEELGDDWAEKDGDVYDAISVINAIESLDGVVVALRPYDRDVELPMGDQIFGLTGISACDVQNGRLSPNSNGLALEAASNLELPCVGLSSAADVSELGTSATLFRTDLATEEELIEAIRHGECWPVLFSAEAPRVSSGQRNRRGRNGRRGDRDNNGRRGRRDGRRNNNRRGSGGGGRRTGRDGNRGRSGGRRGPVSDDVGNRVDSGRGQRNIDENAGNRINDTQEKHLAEDYGNAISTGDSSRHNDVDDNIGNR